VPEQPGIFNLLEIMSGSSFDPRTAAAMTVIATSYASGVLTWDQISQSRGSRLSNLSSVAFGGPDLKSVYLGGLSHNSVHVLRSPVPGAPMRHWQ
jgi:hypothetical protein